MKRIIDGLVFDTDNMAIIYEKDNGLNHNDFNYHDTTLYYAKKQKSDRASLQRAYILASYYYDRSENTMELLTFDEAIKWLESNNADVNHCEADFVANLERLRTF